MPCMDGRDYPGQGMINRETHDLVTRVACKLAKALEEVIDSESDEYGNRTYKSELDFALQFDFIDVEVRDWIVMHRRDDEVRKEKLKISALKKLTAEEKEALGL